MRLALILPVTLAALLLAGCADLPPSGAATFVPPKTPGRSVHLAPFGDFPSDRLSELAAF